MKEILPNIFAVEVQDGASNITQLPNGDLRYFNGARWVDIILPTGYTFLFCSNDDIGETDCRNILPPLYTDDETGGELWLNYEFPENTYEDSALASFASLLRSHNLTGNYAIIKKN